MRNILLLEPNYKNKYPPIGLMKIATYHRMLGDCVTFYKGDLNDFIVDQLYEECIHKLSNIDCSRPWPTHAKAIKKYIKTRSTSHLEELDVQYSKYARLLTNALDDFASRYKKQIWKEQPKWDRVYVTTLFTFYWKITIETIEFAKNFVKSPDQLLVGGVMASLLTEEIRMATGIICQKGLLDKPGVLDPNLKKAEGVIVDDLALDYSILDEIDYEYPTQSAYFTFMTKGCTRKCAFCSVPILEPTYKPKIDTTDKFANIKRKYGEQQNLLLMDNNVLASPKFVEIIDEIKEMGFVKGAMYIEPNQLQIAIQNLKSKAKNNNNRGFSRRCFKLIKSLEPKVKGKDLEIYQAVLAKYDLNQIETITKENMLLAYEEIGAIYEKYRSKAPRQRSVDFNQGTDARYVTDELMKKMGEIPIRPLRLAFDYIGIKDKYINAVRLAEKYGIKELSNYILYNFSDTPEDLYNRLLINVDLVEELKISIYSFPMKYIPLFGEEAKSRDFIGKKWNKKFIRAIQSILNVTKGIVAPGRAFFGKAFGRDLNDFREILYMPETYIVYRFFFENLGVTELWRASFRRLTEEQKVWVMPLIEKNDYKNIRSLTDDRDILELFRHYSIRKEDVNEKDENHESLKQRFEQLIRQDQFINLTLTYDFEDDLANSDTKATGA
jgi:hypothetical protein